MCHNNVNCGKKSISKKNIEFIISSLSNDQFDASAFIPPNLPSNFAYISEIFYKHNSIFIAGKMCLILELDLRINQNSF